LKLSRRIRNVEGSKTVRFTTLIDQLRRQGREIINFAVGEPEYETPLPIRETTKAALDAGATRYSSISGLPELREHLVPEFPGYDAGNILVTNGSKQALYSIFQIICDPGDEVIIPSPYWVSFSEQVKLADGVPVLVPTNADHQLDLDAIEAAIKPETVAILVNSPNNPTGAVYPLRDLEKIAQLAKAHDLYLVSDEAYEFYLYDGLEHQSLFEFADIRDRLLVVKSFSKSYSMTGFRVGYVAGPKSLIQPMTKLQSHLAGNVCTFAQRGADAAFSLDSSLSREWRADLQAKRDIAYKYVCQWFDCVQSQGAFYLFPDVSKQLKPGETAEDFSTFILENAGVAVVPGEAFGMAGHIRISYALSKDLLIRGFEQISRAMEERKNK